MSLTSDPLNSGSLLSGGVQRGTPHLRVLTALPPHVSLTPLVADCRSVGSLVVPAMPAQRIPDAPDAAAGCTESGANGVGTPGAGPPTSCPAPAAASVSSPSPLSSQLLTTALSGVAVALNRVRSSVVVSSCSAQAISRARTVASTLVRCLLRIWLRRSNCFIFLNTSSTCHLRPIHIQHVGRRPGRSRQRGNQQQPTRHGQRGGREGAPGFLRFAALAAPRLLGRGRIEFGGNQPDR